MIKYIVHPGPVRSSSDGQWHHLRGSDLIRLYGVIPRECIIADCQEKMRGRDTSDMIHLYPRYDGNYTLEEGRH